MTSTETHFDWLTGLARSAQTRVILIAPFIKSGVITSLVGQLALGVSLTVYTRWDPEEILHGVSDVSVWLTIADRAESSLSLVQNLHAKVYIFDDAAVVGSSNLTQSALAGTRAGGNLEILISAQVSDPAVTMVLDECCTNGMLVTESVYSSYLVFEQQRDARPAGGLGEERYRRADCLVDERWLPRTRDPKLVLVGYSGQTDVLSKSVVQDVSYDLFGLGLRDTELSRDELRVRVTLALSTHPLIVALRSFVSRPRKFGELVDWLQDRNEVERPRAELFAQNIFRWVIEFIPGEFSYSRPNYTEVLSRTVS